MGNILLEHTDEINSASGIHLNYGSTGNVSLCCGGGKELDKYVDDYKVNEGQIKIIMTGSPVHYKTKNEFLSQHPEYTETGKWKECQILFTGDINSTSSKMEKAKKLGIEIREY